MGVAAQCQGYHAQRGHGYAVDEYSAAGRARYLVLLSLLCHATNVR